MKNPILLFPYLVKKTSNLLKLHYILDSESQWDAFFLLFMKNINSHAHFSQKNVHFQKNTTLPCQYFFKRTSTLSKTQCSHVIFINFIKNPSFHANMWSKNVNYVKTKLYYREKKSRGCTCADLSWNILALMPILCQEIVHCLKRYCSHVGFFNFFIKNPCCHVHIWSKKYQFCQK